MKGKSKSILAGVFLVAAGAFLLTSNLVAPITSLNAEAGEFSVSSFTTVSGDIGTSGYSYESLKGNASTAPAINNGNIRLYQNGATLSISSKEGVDDTLLSITITNDGTTAGSGPFTAVAGSSVSTASALDNPAWGGEPSDTGAAGTVYTVNLPTGSKYFQLTTTGTSSSTRVYIKSIDITTVGAKTLSGLTADKSAATVKTSYKVGEKFDPTGIVVNAQFTDGTTEDVSNYVTWDTNLILSDWNKTAIASYSSGGTTLKATVDGFTVPSTRNIVSIEKHSLPNAKYYVGDAFSSDGLVVYATWDDGETTDVSDAVVLDVEEGYIFTDADKPSKIVNISVVGFGNAITDSLSIAVSTMTLQSFRDDKAALLKHNIRVYATISAIVPNYAGTYNVYIQSGAYACLVYNISLNDPIPYKVGNEVYVTGTLVEYNGLLEITEGQITYVAETGEVLTPINVNTTYIDNGSSDVLLGYDSSLVSISGLNFVSGSIYNTSTSKANSIIASIGDYSFTIRAASALAAAAINEDVTLFFDKLGTQGTFNYTGIVGWYNAPQFAPQSASCFTSSDVDSVDALLALLHMSEDVEGQCQSLFVAAQTAHDALSATQLSMFENNTPYASAKARYESWKLNYKTGDTGNATVVETSNNNNVLFVSLAAGGAAVLLGLSSLLLIKTKKHKKEE